MTLVAGVLGAGSLCFLALESLELVFFGAGVLGAGVYGADVLGVTRA